MRLWYRFALWRWTKNARVLKAVWIAHKETVNTPHRSISMAESYYVDAVVKVKTYRMLLAPELPPARIEKQA